MTARFKQFPRALAERTRSARFGEVPVLLMHPDWDTTLPTVLWLHGRTANKELDPGRYLRWLRAGFAACAIDLPGHGERAIPGMQEPTATLDVLAQAVSEIDSVVEHLAAQQWGGVFDLDRLGIGGMSAGGMVTLRRLCDPHPFLCTAVEGTTGWLEGLYAGSHHAPERVRTVDPSAHLATFRPVPLLALHSEADELIDWSVQSRFLDMLRAHYRELGADPAAAPIEQRTWPTTGAPQEHIGFGRFSNDAKNAQTDFFAKWLRAVKPAHEF